MIHPVIISLVIAGIRAAASHPAVTAAACWCLRVAARALAGSLNVPEWVVTDGSAFALAYVQAAERRAARLCPRRIWHNMKPHIASSGQTPRRR